MGQNQQFKYKVHPNLNKASHSNNILEVKEASKAFKPNVPAPLLKWQMKSNDDAFLPITLSCWPTTTADGTQMVMEFELTDDSVSLENVYIRFPAPGSSRPNVSSASPSDFPSCQARSNTVPYGHLGVLPPREER